MEKHIDSVLKNHEPDYSLILLMFIPAANLFYTSKYSAGRGRNQSRSLIILSVSKIGIFNLEVRLTVIWNKQFGLINPIYIPTVSVGFLDADNIRTVAESTDFKLAEKRAERMPAFSSGKASGINAIECLIIQLYYAYSFKRGNNGA